jgi:hypothetical protein
MPAREVDTGWLMRADFRLETLSGSHESECEKWPAARMLSGLAGRDPGRGCGKTLDLGLRLSEIALIHRQGPRRPGLDRSELVANPSSPKKRRPREVRGQRRDGVLYPTPWHQYFQYQLISHIDPFKRKLGRQNFNELFEKANEKLRKLNEEPDRLRRLAG